MLGDSARQLTPTFLFESHAAFSQQCGSHGKGYSGQAGDESEVQGSWGWPVSIFKAITAYKYISSLSCLLPCSSVRL